MATGTAPTLTMAVRPPHPAQSARLDAMIDTLPPEQQYRACVLFAAFVAGDVPPWVFDAALAMVEKSVPTS